MNIETSGSNDEKFATMVLPGLNRLPFFPYLSLSLLHPIPISSRSSLLVPLPSHILDFLRAQSLVVVGLIETDSGLAFNSRYESDRKGISLL